MVGLSGIQSDSQVVAKCERSSDFDKDVVLQNESPTTLRLGSRELRALERRPCNLADAVGAISSKASTISLIVTQR